MTGFSFSLFRSQNQQAYLSNIVIKYVRNFQTAFSLKDSNDL